MTVARALLACSCIEAIFIYLLVTANGLGVTSLKVYKNILMPFLVYVVLFTISKYNTNQERNNLLPTPNDPIHMKYKKHQKVTLLSTHLLLGGREHLS